MAKQLTGKAYVDFQRASERMATDWAEAAALISEWFDLAAPTMMLHPAGQKFTEVAEAWNRCGAGLAEMIEIATGEDVREHFRNGRSSS